MGYVGNQTTNSYTSLDKQTITGNGGTSYTLDHAVANVNEIEVFVNNVRQEPSVAYTVSGTALTMTGNVEASDDFYVVFQGKAVQTVVPPSDSITTAMINDDAVTSAKINDVTAKQATENTPMFSVYRSSDFSISQSTWTKIPFDSEYTNGDPNSEFDTTNNRYTPQIAGWYYFSLLTSLALTGGGSNTLRYSGIYKNNSPVSYTEIYHTGSCRWEHSTMIYLNGSTDYVDFHVYTNWDGSTRDIRGASGGTETQAHGFLVRAD